MLLPFVISLLRFIIFVAIHHQYFVLFHRLLLIADSLLLMILADRSCRKQMWGSHHPHWQNRHLAKHVYSLLIRVPLALIF